MATQNSSYNNPQMNWISQLSTIPAARCWHSCTAFGTNSVYVMGGSASNMVPPTSPVSTNYLYTISTNTWSTQTAIGGSSAVNRAGHSATTVGPAIYLIGGYDGTTYQNTVYQYTPANEGKNPWIGISYTGTFTGRINHLAVPYGQYIYVIGGQSAASTYLGDISQYDVIRQKWTAITSIPNSTLLSQCYGGVVNDNIYIFGGYNGSALTNCYAYNITSGTWTSLGSFSILSNIYGGASFVSGSYIYLVSGGSSATKKVLRYNTSNNSFEVMGNFSSASTNGINGCALGNKSFVMGGYNLGALSNNNEILSGTPYITSSSYSPSFVPTSNMYAWTDAYNCYSAANGGGSQVTANSTLFYSLKDKSGNGNHFNQSNSGNQFTHLTVAGGANTVCNGYDCFYTSGGTHSMDSALNNGVTTMTYVGIIGNITSYTGGGTDPFVSTWGGGHYVSAGLYQYGNDPQVSFFNGTWSSQNSNMTRGTGVWHLVFMVYNGTATTFKIDNNSDVSTAGSYSIDTNYPFRLGDSYDGSIPTYTCPEFILYNVALTSTSGNGLSVRQYLNNKYNLGLGI